MQCLVRGLILWYWHFSDEWITLEFPLSLFFFFYELEEWRYRWSFIIGVTGRHVPAVPRNINDRRDTVKVCEKGLGNGAGARLRMARKSTRTRHVANNADEKGNERKRRRKDEGETRKNTLNSSFAAPYTQIHTLAFARIATIPSHHRKLYGNYVKNRKRRRQ